MISLSNEMKPMTMAEVREKCPYAFATTPTNPRRFRQVYSRQYRDCNQRHGKTWLVSG